MINGIRNNYGQGFCGTVTKCALGVGLVGLAFKVGGPSLAAIGTIGAAIGTIGYMWFSPSSKPSLEELAQRLVRGEMNDHQKLSVYVAINNFPSDDGCKQVIDLIGPLALRCYDKLTWMNVLEHVPENERQEVVELTVRLFDLDMGVNDRSIGVIASIPANERAARAQRMENQLPLDIQNGLRLPIPRMFAILETPMDEELPPLFCGMGNIRARAVDVHQGDRDVKTIEALENLQELQGDLDPDTITEALKEFKQYLETFEDLDLKAKAKQALEGDREIWPPLLNNNADHTLNGGNGRRFSISGEEFMARLWLFADGLSKQDRNNCRYGMVKALSESIEDGHRVCPPGQMQRQVVAVLQGRLEKTDVDHIVPSINQIVLTLAMSHSKNREDLLEAAETLLIENPLLVDREELMREINAYADITFGKINEI